MMTKEQVASALEEQLNKGPDMEDRIVVLLDKTIDAGTYYVFFYQSRKFLDTNNYSYLLAGNAPIIVDKASGKQFITGTAYPLEHYIEIYENTRGNGD